MHLYTFEPEYFGFRKMPKQYEEYWGQGEQWYKVTNKSETAIWYTVCKLVNADGWDERWRISSAATTIGKIEDTSSHVVFMGCISSQQFAKSLLIHVMGTCKNAGVEEGRKRVETAFLEYA